MRAILIFSIATWWSSFCKKHLIDDDPYQFDHITTERLYREYHETGSELIRREIMRRHELGKQQSAAE